MGSKPCPVKWRRVRIGVRVRADPDVHKTVRRLALSSDWAARSREVSGAGVKATRVEEHLATGGPATHQLRFAEIRHRAYD